MAFERKRFLGLTVIDFSSSVGWNNDGSTLTIKMAPEDGESLSSYTLGDIYDFQMGAFKFVGFLDRVIERHDAGGNFFEAKLSDGKDILNNVQCVVNNFYGVTTDDDCLVVNYFNIFRHFERNKYGDANANESGMDVKKFIQGVNELSVKCGIISASKKYSIDLSNLLTGLPDYYRINGPVIGLMDAISQICEDSGKLWRIVIEGTAFKIQTTSLSIDANNQQVFNSIQNKAKDKKVISWDAGTEVVNNVVSNFVLWGGAKENTIQFNKTSPTDAVIKYFWGYDINGNPYHSTNYELRTLTNPYTGWTFQIEMMDVLLPNIGIEDIWNRNNRYETNTIELMLVMGSQESWEFYLELYEREKYQDIFLRAPREWNNDRFYWSRFGGAGSTLLENPQRDFLQKENDIGVRRAARLYAYLRSMCENYWGKQFLVQVNSGPASNLKGVGNLLLGDGALEREGGLTVRNKLERKLPQDALTDPPRGTYNIVPTNSGWYDPKYPISYIPKEIYDGQFKDAQGKLQNWFVFTAQNGNFQIDDTSPDCYVANQGGFSYIYIKANVAEQYVKVNETEHVHVSLPQTPLIIGPEQARSELGYDALSRFLFGQFGPVLIGSSQLFKVGYAPTTPWNAAIAFRSTTNDVYGPWYVNSKKGGQTKVEHDSTLTPWSFSSGANLKQATEKKLKEIQLVEKFETGSLTMVSLPELSLGDKLQASGAIVTSINANYGPNGVTTQYSFRTFTPRFGIPSRFVIERMKKQTIKQNEDRRNLLKAYMDTIARQQSAYRAEMGSKIRSIFLDFLGRRHDRMSPHSLILMGFGLANAGDGASGGYGKYTRTKIAGASYKHNESLKDIGLKKYDWVDQTTKSCASIDTIYSPFYNGFSGNIPHIWMPRENIKYQSFTNFLDPKYMEYGGFIDIRRGKTPTSITYNPYKLFSHFDTLLDKTGQFWDNHNEPLRYKGFTGGIGSSIVNVNAIALRGPLMVSGWGIDLWTGFITPNGDYGITNSFGRVGNVLGVSPWEAVEQKMTGPVDLVWDSLRGVWTSHDVARIRPESNIPATVQNAAGSLAGGFAYLYTDYRPDTSIQIQVYNLSTKPQYAGVETLAYYSVFDNRWYIKGEGCHPRYYDKEFVTAYFGKNNQFTNKSKSGPYSDFIVTKGVGDPFRVKNKFNQFVPEHACVDTIETSGFSGSMPISFTQCPDGSIAASSSLIFFHGLAKEILPSDVSNPCAGKQVSCVNVVSSVACGSEGDLNVTMNSICGPGITSAFNLPNSNSQVYQFNGGAEYAILKGKIKTLEDKLDKLLNVLKNNNIEVNYE